MWEKLKFCFWGCDLKKRVFYPVVLILDIFNVFSIIGLILYLCQSSAGSGYFRFASMITIIWNSFQVLLNIFISFLVFSNPLALPVKYEGNFELFYIMWTVNLFIYSWKIFVFYQFYQGSSEDGKISQNFSINLNNNQGNNNQQVPYNQQIPNNQQVPYNQQIPNNQQVTNNQQGGPSQNFN